MTTFTQLNARLKNLVNCWLLVLGLKECLVECGTLCVKSEVILLQSNSKTLSPYYFFVMTTIVENYHSTVSSLVTVNCRSMTVMRWLHVAESGVFQETIVVLFLKVSFFFVATVLISQDDKNLRLHILVLTLCHLTISPKKENCKKMSLLPQ